MSPLFHDTPLFAGIPPADLAGLPDHVTIEEHRRGTYLFRSGDFGDSLYVVLTGQIALELATHDPRQVVGLCGPGDWFGELALLTSRPRSASARVAVDATLMRLDRTGWTALSERTPQLFSRVCERLGGQMRNLTERSAPARRAVIACGNGAASLPEWVSDLAGSLRRQFPGREVHLLDPRTGTAPQRGDRPALATALTRLVTPDALILVSTETAGDLADRRLRREGPAEWVLEPGRGGRTSERIRGVSSAAALDRVARHLAGGTVGLALGAGGAFGFAHLGLLDVLEAAGVPIDIVAGASMGAIIGAATAAGIPAARAIAYTCDVATRFRSIVLRDLDLRGRTLLTGASAMRIIGELEELRAASFDDLLLPFVAIAMDVGTGEEIVIDAGPLLEGIRPSFAMPGIFPSCAVGGRALIDGAMVNPVPVDRVRALGADVVIASQPIPALQPAELDPLGAFLGRAQRFVDVLPLRRLRSGIETINVSLRSFQSLWYRLASASTLTADIAVLPDLRDFWFLQFGEAARIIACGRARAADSLPAIRKMLRDRVGLETSRGDN